jgi:hypothetical protein
MRQVRSFVILTGAAALVACATPEPTVPAIAPAAAPPIEGLKTSGYQHVVTRDGTELYCRDDQTTGSRVQHDKVCLTPAQLKASQDSGQDFLSGVQSRAAGAAGAGTAGAAAAMGGAAGR